MEKNDAASIEPTQSVNASPNSHGRKDANATTSVPSWMLISASIFLILRISLSLYELVSPPKPSETINWRVAESMDNKEKKQEKLYFYEFSADWCAPCKQLEDTALSSRDVVKLLNKDFVAVKVIDRKREDGKNANATQELEDSFSVQAFPTIVVALADGTKIEEHLGVINANGLKKFLVEANTLSNYYRGKDALLTGQASIAAEYFSKFLQLTNYSHWRVPYASILCSLSYDEMQNHEKAIAVLNTALNKLKDHSFPYPILMHLAGKISFDQLLKEAGENKSSRLMAYAYSGAQSFAQGKKEEARTRMSWVKANSNDESSFELRIAKFVLNQIDGPGTQEKK